MILVARTTIPGGIVRPSVLADFMLIRLPEIRAYYANLLDRPLMADGRRLITSSLRLPRCTH